MFFSGLFVFLADPLNSQGPVPRLLSSVTAGLLYPVVLTVTSLYLTGRELFLGHHNDAADSKFMNFYKLFEHILEALPQLLISIVYIANNGGPSTKSVQTVSAAFSTGSLVFGLVTGCEVCFVLYSFRFRI